MKALIDLKNIVAKQLPKMPKDYIVRLIMDKNHQSMMILKKTINPPNVNPLFTNFSLFYQAWINSQF
jgi:hypothetical protein